MTSFFVELPEPWVETMEEFVSSEGLPEDVEGLRAMVEEAAALLLANDILRAGMDSYATCVRALRNKYVLGVECGIGAVEVEQLLDELQEILDKHAA